MADEPLQPLDTVVEEVPEQALAVETAKMDVRLSMDWDDDDADAVEFIKARVDEGVAHEFGGIRHLAESLRRKAYIPNPPYLGEGFQTYPDGTPIQDWSRVPTRELEDFVLAGSSEVYFAQSRLENDYAEAVFAKFTYDDAYDRSYSSQLSGTIGDKTARAKRRTMDERWRALFKTLYHKRAKSEVDAFESFVRRVDRIRQDRNEEARRAFMASRSS